MKLFTVILSIVTFLAEIEAADSGYANPDQCKVIQLWRGVDNELPWSIIADCPSDGGGWTCTILDLNNCYENLGGQIVPLSKGGFAPTCHNCVMESTKLSCYCEAYAGQIAPWPYSETQTNDFIGNIRGIMTCFDNPANLCSGSSKDAWNITATDYMAALEAGGDF